MNHTPNGSSSPAAPDAPRDTPRLTVASARAAILDVARLISDARQTMSEGTMVSLAHLETLCRNSCVMVSTLPREKAVQLRSDLEAVLYDLDALETDMTSRFGALARRPLEAEAPRPLTVGAAYQAGIARAAGLGAPRPAPQPSPTADYPPSAAPPQEPPRQEIAAPSSGVAADKTIANPYAAPPSGPRRGWTL